MIDWKILDQTKAELYRQKNVYLPIIYDAIINHTPLSQTTPKWAKNVVKRYITKDKQLQLMGKPIQDSDDALNLILLLNDTQIKTINTQVDKLEKKQKDAEMKFLSSSDIAFVVCSEHFDNRLGKDHAEWQGLVYYNEKYKFSEEEKKYIRDNGLKSIQWVTGKPVYMLTRPHCRHHFEVLTSDKAISGTYTIPKSYIKDKSMQTKGNLAYYRDRLTLLNKLNKIASTKKLRAKILKTRILIQKWLEYYGE